MDNDCDYRTEITMVHDLLFTLGVTAFYIPAFISCQAVEYVIVPWHAIMLY